MKNLIGAVLLFAGFSAFSQEGFSGGSGHFMTGTAITNMSSVNNYLKKSSMPGFSGTAMLIGGGGYSVINNVMIGGQGMALAPARVGNSNGHASFGGGAGMVQMGYLFSCKKILVYPAGGFGWGGTGLTVYNKELNFTESFSSSKFLMNLEINSEIFTVSNATEKAGFKYGLSVGYMFNPQSEGWVDKNDNYADIGNTYLRGFYFKIKIGGGGMKKNSQ